MGIRRIYGHLLKSLKTDVALLGPQIKFALPEIKKLTDQAENEFRKSQQPDFFQVNFDFFFLNDCFV